MSYKFKISSNNVEFAVLQLYFKLVDRFCKQIAKWTILVRLLGKLIGNVNRELIRNVARKIL